MVAEGARSLAGQLVGPCIVWFGATWILLHGCMYNRFVGNPFIRGRPLCVGILCVAGGTPYPTLVLWVTAALKTFKR